MSNCSSILKCNDVIVSSQAVAGSILQDSDALMRIGLDAIAGGANALRLAGERTVELARSRTSLPIIGLIKTQRAEFQPRITVISQEIEKLKGAGADIVAIDSTNRDRPEPIKKLYETAKDLELEIFADIATIEEAKKAMDLGATYIATTMAGYTLDRKITKGPDFELLEDIVAIGGKAVMEGRVSTADQVKKAINLGAYAIVIGRAVTSPQIILRSLLQELDK